LTKEYKKSYREKELETEAKQVLLKTMRRRMRQPIVNMQEEEEALAELEAGFVRGKCVITCYNCGVKDHEASKCQRGRTQQEEIKIGRKSPKQMRKQLLVGMWKYSSKNKEKT
jgi:hypothetical protein